MMDERDSSLQAGMEMGRRTRRILHTVLIHNPRQEDETQEQYADRIVMLIGQQLMQEMGMRMQTHD